jgi:hypothetical protein
VYFKEQRQLQMKAEDEKRLAEEVEQQRMRKTPETWEH